MYRIDRIMHALLLLLVLSGTISISAASGLSEQDGMASSVQNSIPARLDEDLLTEERSQVDVLRERVRSLEARIEQLEILITELTERLDRVLPNNEDGEAQEDGDGQPAAETVAVEPATPKSTPAPPANSDPLSSPQAVANSMRLEFANEMMTDPSFVLGLNSGDPRAQKEADRVLQSWVRRMEGRYRKRITWPITIDAARELPNGDWSFTLQVIGRDGVPESRPFTQRVARRIAQRIENWRKRADLSRLLMKGMLEPRLEIIPRKTAPGPFNTEVLIETDEVLISEWIRFEFSVRLTTIIPIFVQEQSKVEDKTDPPPKEIPTNES
jgi:hypothetical protein